MGKRKTFAERVAEAEQYILQSDKKEITLAELMAYLNVSANYARDIIKVLLIRHNDWQYDKQKIIKP